MAALNAQTLSNAGSTVTLTASAASDTVPVGNGLDTFVVLDNGTGSPVVWTIVVPGNDFLGTAKPDNEVTVAAGSRKLVPIRREYADPVTGRATITQAAPAANISIGVVRLG